jgi:CRP-like cAMP-binding protein
VNPNVRIVPTGMRPLLDVGLERILDRAELVRLAPHADLLWAPAATTLAVEGARPHQFTAIIDGEVCVHRAGRGTVTAGSGAWFGLGELMTDTGYESTVVTTAPRSLVVVVFGPPLARALRERDRRSPGAVQIAAVMTSNTASASTAQRTSVFGAGTSLRGR